MKINQSKKHNLSNGFALVATISVMVLLVMIALAMLSLSTIELRASRTSNAMEQAKANARMALMIALGELQKEMGPDRRVSVESAIFDTNNDTEEINGVKQSHWLASYNSWGNWLNAKYQEPNLDGSPGATLSISDTYKPMRTPMFRRWLLSLPRNLETDPKTALNGGGLNNSNSVVLVGHGTLGNSSQIKDHEITRAYLQKVGKKGRLAWWIGPENQKAKVTLAKFDQVKNAGEAEVSQGDTPEVGVNAIHDLQSFNTELSRKIITFNSLQNASLSKDVVGKHFFDLTAHSWGLVTDVRSGGLKKDLSLLLESSDMPNPYNFTVGDEREPSIRPMSSDLTKYHPKIPGRRFSSWTNMRQYYRMYRTTSDAVTGRGPNVGNLQWSSASGPWTGISMVVTNDLFGGSSLWKGYKNYMRTPILAKLTFIYGLQSVPISGTNPRRYNCYLVYSPVVTLWNPYNVELRIPDRKLGALTLPYKILPVAYYKYINGSQQGSLNPVSISYLSDYGSHFRARRGRVIVFKPGELKIFSYLYKGTSTGKQTELFSGFDPQAIGGDKILIHRNVTADQKPGIALTFGNPATSSGNMWFGNTPGSLNIPFFWGNPNNSNWFPNMYAHDWFQKNQYDTPITPKGNANVAEWSFTDSKPVPAAYVQLVIKTSSEFDYESIPSWREDWRSKNWMQAPPTYFGGAMYISENAKRAHTQRLDNPYILNFGPIGSSLDMLKVVPQPLNSPENSFLGSGAIPYEKVAAAALLELPTAPISSLAGFSNMRINPGWMDFKYIPYGVKPDRPTGWDAAWNSYASAEFKTYYYQSGIVSPGIGNSFIHPMIPRTEVYRFFDNSKSQDVRGWANNTTQRDNKMFCDYWDHLFLLNDALWDEYFISSLTDQTRPGDSGALSLSQNLNKAISTKTVPAISRYHFLSSSQPAARIVSELTANDGYLKAAKYIIVNGMFNVNSTSKDAWFALFSGIRARALVFRDGANLKKVGLPSGKSIALSYLNTAITDKEMQDPGNGVSLPGKLKAWSGVRYLSDNQLLKLAEECVKQVKKRGPFLNYSEFINRRLSNDQLGLMGALQSAIDYDDKSPDPNSINYQFKKDSNFMIKLSQLGNHDYKTPEAAIGSRFTSIPGYVTQSYFLKPLGNELSVRDDTFRIRAYGEALNKKGKVIARAWCEAIVQRVPNYIDPKDSPEKPSQKQDGNGEFVDNPSLSFVNKRFGRVFKVVSFRWLNKNEI